MKKLIDNITAVNELALVAALVVVVVATVVVTIVSGPAAFAATGLRDLSIALGGGLLGAKIPKQPPPG